MFVLFYKHMQEAGVALAALGILGTLTAALSWALKFLLKEFNSTQRELSKSITKQATAADRLNASITKRDVREEQFHVRVMEQFDKLNEKADRNLAAVEGLTINEQHIGTQVVQHEIVKSKR